MRFIHFRENKDSSVQSRELTIAFERTGASKVNYGEIKFGLAYCSATDQFNRKIARRIAGGRCEKQRNNHKYELDGILEPLDNCNGKDMALETVISYVENLLLEGNCPLEFHGMELFAIDFPQLLPLANNYSKEVLPIDGPPESTVRRENAEEEKRRKLAKQEHKVYVGGSDNISPVY